MKYRTKQKQILHLKNYIYRNGDLKKEFRVKFKIPLRSFRAKTISLTFGIKTGW